MDRLWFNHSADRWAIGQRDLHCGDCFQIHNRETGAWADTRIEMSRKQWYLVDLSPSLPDHYAGELARFY